MVFPSYLDAHQKSKLTVPQWGSKGCGSADIHTLPAHKHFSIQVNPSYQQLSVSQGVLVHLLWEQPALLYQALIIELSSDSDRHTHTHHIQHSDWGETAISNTPTHIFNTVLLIWQKESQHGGKEKHDIFNLACTHLQASMVWLRESHIGLRTTKVNEVEVVEISCPNIL